MTKISYDKEVRILSIKLKNNKSVDSDMVGNCVIDYDAKGKIVNIDIMNYDLAKKTAIS